MTAAADTKRISLDLETSVRAALATCERYGITLSGSQFEKSRREAARLEGELHALGGGVGVVDAPQVVRQREIERLRRSVETLAAEADKYRRARIAAPDGLLERLDQDTIALDAVERAAAEGGAQLHKLSAARTKAERQARHALATVLRHRVLPLIARRLEQALPERTVTLCRRDPHRGMPEAAQTAVTEATQVCEIADALATEQTGQRWLVPALGREDVRGLLFPGVKETEASTSHRRQMAIDSGEIVTLDAELGATV